MTADGRKRALADESIAGPPDALVAVVRARLGAADEAARARLGRRVLGVWRDGGRARSGRAVRFILPAGMAAAAAALFLVLRPAPPLTYEITAGRIEAGGELRPAGAAVSGVAMKFSDGSRVALAVGSAARLDAVDARGARLRVREGRAQLDITPRPSARWTVQAGPFLVTVKGTVFSVDWSERTGKLEVRLRRGRVDVSGPLLAAPLAMRPGQIWRADVGANTSELAHESDPANHPTVTIETPAVTPPVTTAEAPPALDPPIAPSPRNEARRPPHAAPPAPPRAATRPADWPALVRSGSFAAIVKDAQSRPTREILELPPLPVLAALADAARYESRVDLSRAALTAMRRRFPRSQAARDASFHLGRLAETGAPASNDALTHYDAYLKDEPRGSFAAEALARKMSLLARTGRTAQAGETAREYLRRFPSGDAAERARDLARNDPRTQQ